MDLIRKTEQDNGILWPSTRELTVSGFFPQVQANRSSGLPFQRTGTAEQVFSALQRTMSAAQYQRLMPSCLSETSRSANARDGSMLKDNPIEELLADGYYIAGDVGGHGA